MRGESAGPHPTRMKTVHRGRIRTQEEVDPHAALPLPQVRRNRLQLGGCRARWHLPCVLGAARRRDSGSPGRGCTTHFSPAEPSGKRKGRVMITALVVALVLIALAAGFVLNRDNTRLRP